MQGGHFEYARLAYRLQSYNTYVPSGLVGGPRAYQDQFRESKSHRVHARKKGFFLHERN